MKSSDLHNAPSIFFSKPDSDCSSEDKKDNEEKRQGNHENVPRIIEQALDIKSYNRSTNVSTQYASSVACKDSYCRFSLEKKKKAKTRRAVALNHHLEESLYFSSRPSHEHSDSAKQTDLPLLGRLEKNRKDDMGDVQGYTNVDENSNNVTEMMEHVSGAWTSCDGDVQDLDLHHLVSRNNINEKEAKEEEIPSENHYDERMKLQLRQQMDSVMKKLKQLTEDMREHFDRVKPDLTLNITEEISRLSKQLVEYQELENRCILNDNFVEAEKINKDITELREKILKINSVALTSPFELSIVTQKNLLDIFRKGYEVVDSFLDNVRESRCQLTVDISREAERKITDLSNNARSLSIQWDCVNRELDRLRKQSESLDMEEKEMQEKISEQTIDYEDELQDTMEQKVLIDAEIIELQKKLEEKLELQKQLNTRAIEYKKKITDATKQFQKQREKLLSLKSALQDAKDQNESEKVMLVTQRETLQKRKRNIEDHVCYRVLFLGLLTLTYNHLEEKLLRPLKFGEEQLSILMRRLTSFQDPIPDLVTYREIKKQHMLIKTKIDTLMQNISEEEKKRMVLRTQLENLTSRKEKAVTLRQFREAACLTDEIRHVSCVLDSLNDEIVLSSEKLEKLQEECEQVNSRETILSQQIFQLHRERASQLTNLFVKLMRIIQTFLAEIKQDHPSSHLFSLENVSAISSSHPVTQDGIPFQQYMQLLDTICTPFSLDASNSPESTVAYQAAYDHLTWYLCHDPFFRSVVTSREHILQLRALEEYECQLIETTCQQWKLYFHLDDATLVCPKDLQEISDGEVITESLDETEKDHKTGSIQKMEECLGAISVLFCHLDKILSFDFKDNTTEKLTSVDLPGETVSESSVINHSIAETHDSDLENEKVCESDADADSLTVFEMTNGSPHSTSSEEHVVVHDPTIGNSEQSPPKKPNDLTLISSSSSHDSEDDAQSSQAFSPKDALQRDALSSSSESISSENKSSGCEIHIDNGSLNYISHQENPCLSAMPNEPTVV